MQRVSSQDVTLFLRFLSAFTEQYFKDGDVTLNERFSALQTVDTSGAEPEELTLDARFSSHR